MQVKKQHLEADMEQWTGSKLGKEYVKAVYCHPVNLTYIWSTSCEMGRMNHKLESRFLGEISTTSDTKPLILRSPLMRVKEESKKAVLKLKIQNTKMMASSPIASWQIDGEKVETVADFIFLGSKIMQMVTEVMKLKDTCSLEESHNKPRQHIKKAETLLF